MTGCAPTDGRLEAVVLGSFRASVDDSDPVNVLKNFHCRRTSSAFKTVYPNALEY